MSKRGVGDSNQRSEPALRQDGWFPLAIAAYHGRLRVAEALVAARADPDLDLPGLTNLVGRALADVVLDLNG